MALCTLSRSKGIKPEVNGHDSSTKILSSLRHRPSFLYTNLKCEFHCKCYSANVSGFILVPGNEAGRALASSKMYLAIKVHDYPKNNMR